MALLSRGRGEPPLGRLSCFLGEEVGHPEFLSVRQACVLGPREAPPALCAKGSSWTSQPWGLLVCRHPPPTPPSAAPAGWGLLGGRAHRPQGAIWQAGFLLRTLPHLGLLPASSASEKHTLGIL